MTKPMGRALSLIQMDAYILENGKMINSTEMVQRSGLTELNSKVITDMARNLVEADSNGQMETHMKVTLKIT